MKVLTNNEIDEIKENLKINKRKKKITKRGLIKKRKLIYDNKSIILKDTNQNNISLRKKQSDVIDICTIIEKWYWWNIKIFKITRKEKISRYNNKTIVSKWKNLI